MPTDTIKPKKSLGKGLASLIPGASSEEKQKIAFKEVYIDMVTPRSAQPRKKFDKESLEKLAESIKRHGVLQPLVVSKKKNGFEIIAGERRFRASLIAGLEKVPVYVKNLSDQKKSETSLVENVQRQDLNPIEEASAYRELVNRYGLTHSEIAKRVAKDRATISNLIRILSLSSKVRSLLMDQKISLGIAKVLLKVEKSDQNFLAQKAIKDGLSVRALEKLVSKKEPKKTKDQTLSLVQKVSDKLSKKLNTKVFIKYKNEKGYVGISFYSSEEFNDLVLKLETLRKS